MANLEAIIESKSEQDSQWQAQRQSERENVNAMQDAGVELITTDPEYYARFLDMQGDNPTYSAGNVAIVMVGIPEATVFGTAERWQSLHRTVNEGEVGVKIFARSKDNGKYILSDAYDISQTKGQNIRPRILRDDTPEMAAALKVLLNFSKAKPVTDRQLDSPAYYDEAKQELAINPDYPDGEAFAAIAAEVALTRYHDKGANRNYNWERYMLDAQSVSYILCRRYGIEPKAPNMEGLDARFAGADPQSAREILDGIHRMSKQMGNAMDNAINEQQRKKNNMRRPSR